MGDVLDKMAPISTNTSAFPVNSIPQVLYTHLHLQAYSKDTNSKYNKLKSGGGTAFARSTAFCPVMRSAR
jgi:hypothetical protein